MKKKNKKKTRKKHKLRKKDKRIKITKKTRSFRTVKQLAQPKKLTVRKVLSFIPQSFIKLYGNFRQKLRKKKLKKIDFEKKEKEKLRKHMLLESIKLEKRIEAYRRKDDKSKQRELKQIKRIKMMALKEERDSYRPVLDSIKNIVKKYRLIKEQKRVQSLGLEVDSADTKESLLEKQKAYEKNRQKIEFVLEPYFRLANSLVFQINKKFIPKHKSIMRIIDRRYEESMCFIHYDDEPTDDWIILFYLDSNPDNETIVVEDKTNPEKFVTKMFKTREIFAFSDYLVDQICLHIGRERQKKAS